MSYLKSNLNFLSKLIDVNVTVSKFQSHFLEKSFVNFLEDCLHKRPMATQHNDTQQNDTQHNDTQHNDTQHNDNQHNETQNNDIQHLQSV